jgi:hypothetical protein
LASKNEIIEMTIIHGKIDFNVSTFKEIIPTAF